MPDSREPQLDDLRRRARRRLIGAIVLALAAAVLVPLLLESDPKPLGEDVAVKIPPVGEGKFATKGGEKRRTVEPASAPVPETRAEAASPVAPPMAEGSKDATKAPLDAPKEAAAPVSPMAKSLASAEQRVLAPATKPAPAASPAPAKAAPAPVTKDAVPAPAPAKAATAPVTRDVPAPAPAKAATAPVTKDAVPAAAPKAPEFAPKAADADKGAGFAVQLAAFTDDKGANALAGRLNKAGYPAYTEPYDTSRGKLWRVRVGPYPSRDAAEGVRAKLKGEGQNGFIAPAK